MLNRKNNTTVTSNYSEGVEEAIQEKLRVLKLKGGYE